MWFFDHYFAHHFFRFSFSRKTHARIPRKHDVLSNYFKIQQFYTVLINPGAILNIQKFMTLFAESNLQVIWWRKEKARPKNFNAVSHNHLRS